MYLQANPADPVPLLPNSVALLLVFCIVAICTFYVSKYLETLYAAKYKKPFFVHFYPIQKRLPADLQVLLQADSFYKRLHKKHQTYFEHRVACFLETTTFIGREGIVIDADKKMKISTMFVQLTFGMRHYLLTYVETIIIYPSTYYSKFTQTDNNGEFNPASKAIVLSWEHFVEGNSDAEDGINLGIHEITHAIHYGALRDNNVSAAIFYEAFLELEAYLASEEVRNQLVATNVLRAYAFTDKFEFIAVLVEVFMESPDTLKAEFPELHTYVMQMLNFNYFADKQS